MLLTPHTIVGATIATIVANPMVALPLTLISHFLVDLTPHWNPHLNQEMKQQGFLSRRTKLIVLTDAGISLIIGSLLGLRFYPHLDRVIIVYLGCFLAILPDFLESPYFFLGIKNQYLEKIMKVQKKLQWNISPVWGIFTQIILISFCFLLLFP